VESLALAAALVIMTVFLLGTPAVVFAIRPPRSRFGRVALFLIAPLSFLSGLFLFSVVVTAFRLFGLGFMVASVVAVVRAVRSGRHRPGEPTIPKRSDS
jgi:hypothetical protein